MNIRKDMKKIKKDVKGITLIALVVTIIVLLILAGIALNLTIGENGIFTRAQDAANTWRNAENNEQLALQEGADLINSYLNGSSSGSGENEEPIEETTSFVCNYADINGDGTVDGVIYADLAVGGSGQWREQFGKLRNTY